MFLQKKNNKLNFSQVMSTQIIREAISIDRYLGYQNYQGCQCCYISVHDDVGYWPDGKYCGPSNNCNGPLRCE